MKYDDIVPPSDGGGLAAFGSAPMPPDYSPIPAGIYTARVLRGEVVTTSKGSDGYRLRFEVIEGPQKGRTAIRTFVFTPKALGHSQKALAPFGLRTQADLLQPFPSAGREYICRLFVALQRGDDGIERNDIKKIDILRVEKSAIDDYVVPDLPNQSEGGTP